MSRPPVSVPNLRKESIISKLTQPESKSNIQELLSKYPLLPEFCKNYDIEYELGRGGFGFVVAGRRKKDDHAVAIKFIFQTKVARDSWVRDSVYGIVPLEVYILRHCSHPNIIKFQEYYDHPPFSYLIMDLHGSHWNRPYGSSYETLSKEIKVTGQTKKTKTISTSTIPLSDLSIASSIALGDPLPNTPEKPTSLSRGVTLPFPTQLVRRPSMDLFE